MQNVGINIIAALIVLIVICLLPTLAKIFPQMLNCLIRWKESVNVQKSAARMNRDIAALVLIPLFVFLCAFYHIHPKTADMEFFPALGFTALVFSAYCVLRIVCRLVFRSSKISRDDFDCAANSAYNFFIIAVILMALTSLICTVSGITGSLTAFLLWETAAVYIILLIRKTQIFIHYRGFFAGILYLCTLEILPTSLLVASVWFL